MSEVSNLNYSSTGRNVRTNYIMNSYPEGSKYYHKENIVSKNQDGKQVYQTAEQEYSVSYDEGGNAIKLDSLLDDLKNERNLPTANTISITENRPLLTHTSPLQNSNTNVYKKTYHEKVSSSYNANTHPERNAYHETTSSTYNTNTLPERNVYHENVSSTYNTNTLPERNVYHEKVSSNYNTNILPERNVYHEKNSSTYNTNTVPERIACIDCSETNKFHDDVVVHEKHYSGKNLESHHTSTKKITSSGLPQDIKEIALVDNILPGPGTKVTTTVRTYTYEIPNNITVTSVPFDQIDSQTIGDRRHNLIETTNVHNKYYSQNGNPPTTGSPVIMPNDMETDRTYYYKNISTNTRNIVRDHPTEDNFTKTKYELDKTIIHHDNDRYPPKSNVPIPSPFPIDETDKLNKNNIPPKRLDDLMATFENGKSNQNYGESYESKVELDTATASPGKPPVESRALSKNVQGPPVFYPPGQEMIARKEEMSAGYRAHGSAAHASGGYEYGAESSSKSKSKSGAAVVPVCLPLCCAMPCTIM